MADILKAGKIAVGLINEYFSDGVSFNQETTLCGKTIEKNIQKPRSEEKQEMKVTNLFVQKAMDYISMNYSQKLTLTKISEQLCITPNYLSELFKKHTGQNVSEYIIDYRLEKACQFLKNPQLRIGEVSEKVGINDVRYFSSMFKKKYNLTPTEYRNKQ